MSDERFVFYPTSNYIKDRETDHTYFCNNRNVCKLLNELNEKANHNAERYIREVNENKELMKVLRSYSIFDAKKLDQVLLNERTW